MKRLEKNEMIEYLESIGESERMIKYYLDTYYFYTLKDGLIIELRKKPSIDKTLWFDDEYEIPKLTEELFIRYNEKNVSGEYAELDKNDYIKAFLIQRRFDDKKNVAVQRYQYMTDYEAQLQWAKNKNYFVRFMEDEEIEEYNKVCHELKDEYIERLKKYFKRYQKNIYCQGYWANR